MRLRPGLRLRCHFRVARRTVPPVVYFIKTYSYGTDSLQGGALTMPKKSRKTIARKAAANKRLPKRNASAVAKGAAFSVLAGRPSKQAVTAVFGKAGYALSWIARA